MAKKKKTATPSFDPGRFRQAEEASMAGFTPAQPAPVVDERTQVRAKLGLPPLEVSTTDTTEVPTMDPREGVKEIKEGAGSPTIVSRVDNGDGTFTITFSDGTVQTTGTKIITKSSSGGGKKVVSTYTNPETGDVIAVYDDGTTAILSKGTKVSDAAKAAAAQAAAEKAGRQSAFDLLFQQFNAYGLGGLVEPLRALIQSDVNPAEFTLKLRETDAYKKRFAANQSRIARGLRALSEAEYIGLEDQYQDVMRRYGLPQSYYARGDMGRQEGFEKFISGDVSPVELEDRIQTAQNRITNAPTQIKDALSQFYGAELGNGDILAFVLDPDKALPEIKRKVTAAEIGGAATMAGLGATRTRAEELGRFGVTGEAARQGFQTIAEFLPTAQKLGDIYAKQGMGPFTQTTAEEEVFGITGAAEAGRKRRKLAELETAAFSGQAGAAGGALARERAGSF